jgi:quinoprotein glucose dehydrogenase
LHTLCRRLNRKAAGALIGLAAIAYGQNMKSVWEGVYTADQAKRGAALYASSCANCHGTAMTGGDEAPPLTGGEFMSNWNGLTVGDLFDRIRTTMPADHPGSLTRQQNADVVAEILSANQFPAGKSELDTRSEFLKQIRISSTK